MDTKKVESIETTQEQPTATTEETRDTKPAKRRPKPEATTSIKSEDTGAADQPIKKKKKKRRMEGAGYYNLMVQQIYVLQGRRQGKALKFMLKLLELSKTLGFTGVELNQATSPAGEQLLRKLVQDHGWCTNGKVPEKKEAQILNVHDQPIPNDERVTEYDDLYGCEAIDSVHDLGPRLDRVRKNGGMLNGGRTVFVDNSLLAKRYTCPSMVQGLLVPLCILSKCNNMLNLQIGIFSFLVNLSLFFFNNNGLLIQSMYINQIYY